MLMFNCSMCGSRNEVEDDLAGKVVSCRKCGERHRVSPPPQAPNVRPVRRGAPRWLLAGAVGAAVGLAACLVWAGIALLANNPTVAKATESQTLVTKTPPSAEQAALQRTRAEVDALKSRLEQEVTEQAKLREEQELRDESRVAEEALKEVRSLVADMQSIDKEARTRLAREDKRFMELLALSETEPTNESLKSMKYYKGRCEYVADATARLQALSNKARELIRQTEARPQMRGDTKLHFVQEARAEMATARGLLEQGLPEIDTRSYYEQLASIREEKVKKSKGAADSLTKFVASLPDTSDYAISQFNIRVALFMMGRLQLLHKEHKMTRKAVQKELNDLPPTLDLNKYTRTLETLVRYGGGWRVGHDPACPSISETYSVMQKLLAGEVGDPK